MHLDEVDEVVLVARLPELLDLLLCREPRQVVARVGKQPNQVLLHLLRQGRLRQELGRRAGSSPIATTLVAVADHQPVRAERFLIEIGSRLEPERPVETPIPLGARIVEVDAEGREQLAALGRVGCGSLAVARLLVRSLIPKALPARSMADAETVPVRYARLDDPASPVRLRLSSTVVRVRNNNPDPADANEVEVVYVRDGKAKTVRAKGCVLACYNAAIPYMVPELPTAQKEALSKAVRAVMLRTQVAIRDWKAFEKLGVSRISCPGSAYPGYGSLALNPAVTMGDYQPPSRPDEPIVITLDGGVQFRYKPGMTAREMFRATRQALYETSFEQFELRIRTHMARVLSDGGFDPARDIAGITLNRWGHGYAMGQNLLFDPD